MSPKLYLAIPAYGSVPVPFVESLLKLITAPPCTMHVGWIVGDSLVTRARNTITATFLETDCTHLLFLDCDIVFSPTDVQRLLSRGKDVVGGLYAKKKEGSIEWVANALNGTVGADREDENSTLRKVRHIGTGFLLIARNVFERIRESYPLAYETTKRTEWDFWSSGPHWSGKWEYMSEDWIFCERCRKIGIPVYADLEVTLGHVGQASYPLEAQKVDVARRAKASESDIARAGDEIQGWCDFHRVYEEAVKKGSDGDHFVEVGCWKGKSSVYLGDCIRRSGKQIDVLCVDTWEGTPGEEAAHAADVAAAGGSIFPIWLENVRRFGLGNILRPVASRSMDAAEVYRDETVQFLFLDADHNENAVRRDLKAWWPKIKPGGTIAGHDYRYSNGVRDAVDAFFRGIAVVEVLQDCDCWRVRKMTPEEKHGSK